MPLSVRAFAGVVVLLALLIAPGRAVAQSGALGPGPFSTVKVKPKGLVFDVDRSVSDAALFAGVPSVAVVVDGTEIAFDASPKVKKEGARLQQSGTAGGRTIDALFPQGQSRHVTIRNGDGATTELEVARRGSALDVTSIVRRPESPAPTAVLTATAQVQGSADSATDLRLAPEAGPTGVPVTVDASLPSVPATATATVVLRATSMSSSATGRSAEFPVAGASAAMRLVLPTDSYRLTAEYTVVVGSLATSELTITRRVDVGRTIAVSQSADRFAVDLPAISIPALQNATVSVSGAHQFEAAPGGGNAVLVTLATAALDGSSSYAVAAMRELSASGSVSVGLSAPAGSYQGAVSVLPSAVATGGEVAANYHVASLVIQSAGLPGTVSAAFPAVTRVPSALRDPSGLLPPADLAHPGAVAHLVSLTGIVGLGTQIVTSTAVVLDDSKDFPLYLPAGAVGTVLPVLDLTGSLPDGRALENVTLTYNPGLFFAAAPARIDVVVPSLPRLVKVAGRVLDPQSAPVAGATAAAFTATVEGLVGGAVSGLYVTGSDGRFAFDVPPAATYTLTAVFQPGASSGVAAKRPALPAILDRHLAELGATGPSR
jgi:hypothetical protein